MRADHSRMSIPLKWMWTGGANLAFQKFQGASPNTPILKHFKLAILIILQTNASGAAITGMFKSYDGFSICRPVIFCSQLASSAEQTNNSYNQ